MLTRRYIFTKYQELTNGRTVSKITVINIYLRLSTFIDIIFEDVVMYTAKRQNNSYNAITSHFMLGFNISYKTTLPA